MSLLDRLRDLFNSGGGSGAAGAGGIGGAARRRGGYNQAQPLTPGVRSYDVEPTRPMARAQWIGLGLAAALAVALTAGLVFVIMSVIQPSGRVTPTPTAAPVVATSPTPTISSIAQIFATFTPTPPSGPSPTPPTVVGQRVQVAGTGNDGLTLRRDPGQNGERIKNLREGSVVEIAGPDQTIDGTVWRNVRDGLDTGWVAAIFLAPEGSVSAQPAGIPGSGQPSSNVTIVPAATPAAAPKPTSPGVASAGAGRGQVGNTNGQGANIRSEPGSSGRVLKTVPEGANLEVLGPEREVDGQIWRQVRDSSGVTGWIIRGAVAPAGSVPTPVPPSGARPPAGPTSAPATKPASGGTQTPSAKPTTGTTGAPPTTAPAAPKPTTPPGNLPIIIQPATPRPTTSAGGAAATATPRP